MVSRINLRITMKNSKRLQAKLIKLLDIFHFYSPPLLQSYLAQKPWSLFGFKIGQVKIPMLFWDGKELQGQYDSVIQLCVSIGEEDGHSYLLYRYDFVDKVAEYLTSQGISQMIVVANWEDGEHDSGQILETKPKNLRKLFQGSMYSDTCFFGENHEWILAFNHFQLGFFTGSRDFIEGFKEYYPEYRKFVNYKDSCSCCD